jgi:hypothetical protein
LGGKLIEKCVQSDERKSMVTDRTKKIWLPLVAAALVSFAVVIGLRHWSPAWMTIQGAVIRRDSDSRQEGPIAGAHISLTRGATTLNTQSDASGYFKFSLRGVVWPGQELGLTFEHPDYETLEMQIPVELRSTPRRLVVASMVPVAPENETKASGPSIVVTNIRVRYTENTKSDQNIGSVAKTFQVVNQGNIPCHQRQPCSPDGSWKASVGSVELDAGPGSEFRNVRASCIAGPCPFTRIDSSGFANPGRVVRASALAWSDTATFLVEAEVYHAGIVSSVRQAYPVIFGRALNFTVPPTQEGVSLIAELNGAEMVFPFGPDLEMSWASCSVRQSSEVQKAKTYECDLKPGYRF